MARFFQSERRQAEALPEVGAQQGTEATGIRRSSGGGVGVEVVPQGEEASGRLREDAEEGL